VTAKLLKERGEGAASRRFMLFIISGYPAAARRSFLSHIKTILSLVMESRFVNKAGEMRNLLRAPAVIPSFIQNFCNPGVMTTLHWTGKLIMEK